MRGKKKPKKADDTRVQQLHAESVRNLGSGSRKELGKIRKDGFRKKRH
jgi:hypothetical protein